MGGAERSWIVGVTPFERPNADLVIALARAGAFGVLDLGRDRERAVRALDRVLQRTRDAFGIRVSDAALELPIPERVSTVLVTDPAQIVRWPGRQVWVEVTSVEEAHAAVEAGAHALVARGSESGGRVGDTACFVLLQQLLRSIDVPVLAQGGIGLHTAAAAVAGGAAGVVLDAQLALVRESDLPAAVRAAIGSMDGSETVVVGGHRVYTRPDLPVARLGSRVAVDQVRACLGGDDLQEQFLPVGQDGAFARPLADRFKTAGGVVVAVRNSIESHIESARKLDPLAPRSPFAASHGIEFPIAQGPMTRVSDRAEFAAAVAAGGGLPFLALALMSGPEVRKLLDETVELLGDRPWGVGILGFVPPEIRDAQLEEVRRVRPPVALIAGGRPSQARALEEDGIPTYLHVPSPGLLARFLKDGARRFVFEGRECGGHVGPRSSFALWEPQVQQLLAFEGDLSDVHVIFAGGIHDARSAGMVAALSGELARRGARIGVIMGSAYVLTEEAVSAGAIQPFFQQAVIESSSTVLLETSPGHAIRTLRTPYVDQFYARKRELEASGASAHDVWAALEDLNLGRLRIASKGLKRQGGEIVHVDRDEQLRDGMFMIGQVATMRHAATRIIDLHLDVSEGSSDWLSTQAPRFEKEQTAEPLDIAIIGMAACFPQAEDLPAFWSNVVHGVDAITEVPEERWRIEDYYDPDAVGKRAGEKSPSKWGGFLPEIPFDALALGIPPRSLPSIETVQLLSLEMARRALADAGYADREFDRERTAVIFGAEAGTDLSGAYGLRNLFPQYCGELPEELDRLLPRLTEDSFPGVLTNVIAGRVANRLDLGGANFTVDAACATSMAALDQACKELRTGGCDMVLCGAADLHNGIADYLLFGSVHALSPTGRCRTFDSEADGIALGEGVACLVLKRLADAERDGDRIYSIVRGCGASSDGRSLGLTAPRPEGQHRALRRAYAQSGISPAEIGMVEAHGTGTVVGDRTELAALTDLYRASGARLESCALGSVKAQIGHTKCAAGMAGMIKAALSLYYGVRTPTAHIRTPNPAYDPATSPFFFAPTPQPWLDAQRHAAISAFGFGGSNFHAVLSAYDGADVPARGLAHWPAELVLIRGESPEAAREQVARLRGLLDANDAAGGPFRLRDIARTISTGSDAPVQAAAVAQSLNDLRAKLPALEALQEASGVFVRGEAPAGKLAFLFPGQGSQRVGMLADLYVAFPRLQRILRLGTPWLDKLFPRAVFTPEERAAQQAAVTDTRVAQPVLGLADLTLHELLGEFGVVPEAVAGHSYGELVALCVAGCFGEQELLALSAVRARAILDAAGDDPGAMAAVEATAGEVEAALQGLKDVVIANENAPRQMVVSGTNQAIDRALEMLESAGLSARRIPVACAFHSPVVAEAAERLAKELSEITLRSPRMPVSSNTTGRLYPYDPDAVSELLAQQVALPVRFREQIENLYVEGVRVFVEAGPGRVLSGLVKKILGDRPHTVVPCDIPGEPGVRSLLSALGRLAVHGVTLSMDALYEGRDARVLDAQTVRATRPHYRLDGYTLRNAKGEVVEGAVIPVNEMEPVQLGAGVAAPSGERDVAVHAYLKGMRELVAAQREVMLGYLGAPVTRVETFDVEPIAARSSARAIEAVAARPAPRAESLDAEVEAEGGAGLSGEELMSAVLSIVSERTGYPDEMLEPDLDLEADLSIDSIKRMEILGELAERVDLPGSDGGELDESVIAELARLKTLREIVVWIEQHADGASGAGGAAASATDQRATVTEIEASSPVPEATLRYRFAIVPREPSGGRAESLDGLPVRILGGSLELRQALADRIEKAGGRVCEARSDDHALPGAAWIHLGPLCDDGSGALIPRMFAELREQVIPTASRILVATGVGGRFGHSTHIEPIAARVCAAAGVRGLVRTFAREYPDQTIRAVDVDPGATPEAIAEILVSELLTRDTAVDVGYAGGTRTTLELRHAPLDRSRDDALQLGPDSVVVVTGGARGIGARATIALAKASGCHVELIGRSPLPRGDEPPEYADAHDAPALRRAILARGELRKPAEIEAECARILAAREIRSNIAELEGCAASVTYHSVDVRDPEAFAGLLGDIRARRGRIDGVLHAAGILEDKLIRDKTPESFARVFGTKVDSVRTLAKEIRPDVGFVVLFGSIAGAFGNRGQVDYAAANEALAMHGRRLQEHVDGRVVTMAWGPWGGGGMVTPELEREYHRRGIGLIEPDDGVQCLVDELRYGAPDDVEVVFMRAEPLEWTVPVTRATPHEEASGPSELAANA